MLMKCVFDSNVNKCLKYVHISHRKALKLFYYCPKKPNPVLSTLFYYIFFLCLWNKNANFTRLVKNKDKKLSIRT